MTPRPPSGAGDEPRRPFWEAIHQAQKRGPRRPKPARPPHPATLKPAARIAAQAGKVDKVETAEESARKKTPPRTPANMAARIVARSGRDLPADQELRETLRNAEGLRPGDARWISRAVFAYFRWQAWLDDCRPLEQRLDQAIGYSDTYSRQPQRFPDDDLVGGALPEWVREVMEIPVNWVRALQKEPRLWLRARPGMVAQLAEKLGGAESTHPGQLPDSLEYTGREDLFRTPEFHGGEFEIQDPGSQAVGLCCAPKPGEKWWDVCAGEGGKTLHLADLLQGRGLVYGSDRADWRLDRLRTRAVRAHLSNWQVALWDEGRPAPGPGRFDGVLLDAPCSGLGTWGRNPHARWTTTRDDVQELAAIQRRLLKAAAAAVKPGGRLVYAVCTMTRPETTDLCDAFALANPDFTPESVPNPFGTGEPAARHTFWPHETRGNGMFVAVWRRADRKAPSPGIAVAPESAPAGSEPPEPPLPTAPPPEPSVSETA